MKRLYYNTYPLTLYFQVQFVKVHGSPNNKNDIKSVKIYLLKVNNRNAKARCEICSELTIKTPERRQKFSEKLTFLTT